jgi:trk system potassium uptake protein TrkH
MQEPYRKLPTPVRRVGDRTFRLSRPKPVRIHLEPLHQIKAGGASFNMVVFGFAAIILIGAIFLILPFSSKSGAATNPLTALFTATSSVCVTGLVLVDTGTYWSGFGQAVILVLIQIGGLGFMTSATLFLLAIRGRISLREKILAGQAFGLENFGGLAGLIKRVVLFSLVIETVGAALLFLGFRQYGSTDTAVWRSVFHAVSAFNNAGFDILGNFSSLINYRTNAGIILTITCLIILGGISFIVLEDLIRKRRFTRLQTDTKIVLITTGLLLLLAVVFYFFAEYSNPETMGGMPLSDKLLISLFQSVTPRTAGFTTLDIGRLGEASVFFTLLLMFIGGASGSTAGGVKVNTLGLLLFSALSAVQGKEKPGAFGRTFMPVQIYRAMALIIIYIALVSIVALTLWITEGFNFTSVLFETFSAFGTVGLTTGITPLLTTAGRIIIILAMFVGRLGPLALASILVARQKKTSFSYPEAFVRIG